MEGPLVNSFFSIKSWHGTAKMPTKPKKVFISLTQKQKQNTLKKGSLESLVTFSRQKKLFVVPKKLLNSPVKISKIKKALPFWGV